MMNTSSRVVRFHWKRWLLLALLLWSWPAPLRAQDLSLSGWRMWPDTNAVWANDPLFLPDQVVLSTMPSNAPSGGWNALGNTAGIPVTLPATVEQYYWGKLQGTGADNGNYLGVSWWWRTFNAPTLQAGQRLIVKFRAARMRAEVFCNQKLRGYNLITEIPFEADITDAIQPGTNQLAVRITNPGGHLDWRDIDEPITWGTNSLPESHAFGGLDAGVILEVRDAVHVSDFAVLNRPDPHEVRMVVEVRSTGPAYNGPVNLVIQQGATVLSSNSVIVAVPAGGTNSFINVAFVPNAQLWDVTNPVLYSASATIPGETYGGRTVNFGFRWFTPENIGTNALLRLNGKRIVLRSAISWGYWAPNGLFPDDALAQKEVYDAKTLGLNCLQFHRNIGHPNVLDQHDQQGVLRYEEAGAGFNTWSDQSGIDTGIHGPTNTTGIGGEPENFRRKYEVAKILAMVRRDRSHPALAVYCVQNEEQPDLRNPHIWWLFNEIQKIDPSRTVYLHSGVPAFNQVVMLPFSTNFLYENGTGYSGWNDQHTVGGPGNYQDNLYVNPTSYSHFSNNKQEISMFGEMLGVGVPDDHDQIVHYYQTNNSTGYDLALHQQVLGVYNDFLDRWNFRSSFPTASSVFQEVGKKSYFFWQKIMEGARMCDTNDYLVISGWESTTIDNHSGLVDAHRNFRADPTLLSKAMSPEVLVIRPKRFVLKSGEQANVDVHLINETGRSGAQTLTITARSPDGTVNFTQQKNVTVAGGDVYGQLLATNFTFTPITNGTITVTGVLQPNGGSGTSLTNTAEIYVVSQRGGAPLLTNIVVLEDDGKISQTLSNIGSGLPLNASHLADPNLDAVVVAGGSTWLGQPYSVGDAVTNTPDPSLFQVQMFGKTGTIGVWSGFATGQCTVAIYLAEQFWTTTGSRRFDLAINDNVVLQNFDIVAQTGFKDTALVKTFTVNATSGSVKISVPNVEQDNISLGAIKITDSAGKTVAVAFRPSAYTDSTNLVWQPYVGTLAVSDAAWNTVIDRVARDGVRLVLWPNGLGEANGYVNRLVSANIVEIGSAAGRTGSLPEAGASWMGSWYFARKHWLFDGLPVDSVLGWQYQIPHQGANVNALLLGAAPGKPMEVAVGYGRDHEAAVGIGACVIHHGRGEIVLPSLPDVRDALTATGKDITQPVALRLLGNALRVQPNDLPAPWQYLEIGNVGTGGWKYFQDNAFGLAAAGADIWNQADAFGYVYQPFTGDGVITARVASQQATDVWAKGGVMFRESLAPGSRHALMVVTPGNGASFQRRLVTDDVSYEDQTSIPTNAPYWVRLVRAGDQLSGYASADGVNWVQVGATVTLTNLPATIYCGLAVTAHTTSTPSLVSFDQVTLNHAPVLALVASRSVSVGLSTSITNTAVDIDAPPQTLSYILLAGPVGATIDPVSGIVRWRPGVSSAGTTNFFSVQVRDGGFPDLSAAQSFYLNVNPVNRPGVSARVVNGSLQLHISGDFGPDYLLQGTTNLDDPLSWVTLGLTNPPVLPFDWTASSSNLFSAFFYRVLLGPG